MFRRLPLALLLLVCVGCSSAARAEPNRSTSIVGTYTIESESMAPALETGDRVDAVGIDRVERGDVIVFHVTPGSHITGVEELVKRVVGMPGEVIEGRGGHIYIDGRRLSEPYLRSGVVSKTFGPVQVPPGSYFVLGDNRQFSNDSTVWGPLRRALMVGRIPT